MEHKPIYHFRPESNWINDPNAPIYFNGEYHLFYQYNPSSWEWGNLHWGHAKSPDMIHWQHLPVALAPAKERGENYCFSGCGYEHDGKVELFYTSIGVHGHGEWGHIEGAQQWVATTEDMLHWKQIPENPVLSNADNRAMGLTLTHWRDPFVFRYRGETLMVIAGVVDGWKGAIHIYRSRDMRQWEYLNCFFTENIQVVYECPNVVVFGDKLALIYTRWKERIGYVVGTLNDDYSLNVVRHGEILDPGPFYATNVFTAADGRQILLGWLQENDRNGIITDGAWSGAIGLPRELSLNGRDELCIDCAREVDALRGKKETFDARGFQGRHVFATRTGACEICAVVEGHHDFVISVLGSLDGREHTDIRIDPNSKSLCIDRSASTLLSAPNKADIHGRFRACDGPLTVRVFVDNSILEVFVNGQFQYSARVYPTNTDRLTALEAWNGGVDGRVDLYTIERP